MISYNPFENNWAGRSTYQFEENERRGIIRTDGINGCRWITDLVSTNHLSPYFLPRSNVTFRSKEFAGCSDMLYFAHNVRRIGFLEIMDDITPHLARKGG